MDDFQTRAIRSLRERHESRITESADDDLARALQFFAERTGNSNAYCPSGASMMELQANGLTYNLVSDPPHPEEPLPPGHSEWPEWAVIMGTGGDAVTVGRVVRFPDHVPLVEGGRFGCFIDNGRTLAYLGNAESEEAALREIATSSNTSGSRDLTK